MAPRLSIDDWIEAGYALLADEGLQALKIDRLCAVLGVTKGSFYWHFTDMAGYRAALVQSWAEQRGEQHTIFAQIRDRPPRERLTMMVEALISPQHWRLECTMREWARSDKSVAAAVDAADRLVLGVVRQAFVELGFTSEEAKLRATATFAAGIGFLSLSGAKPGPLTVSQRKRFLDIMIRP